MASPAPPRRRYTEWLITINTNHAAASQREEEYLVSRLEAFIREVLGREETWKHLVRIKPGWSAVDHISLQAIAIERGHRRRFLHVHLVALLEHHGSADFIARGAQRNLQDLLNRFIPSLRGAYAQIQPGNASHLNYISKQSGQQPSAGIQAPVVFE